jgi:Amt family ammonium transporter
VSIAGPAFAQDDAAEPVKVLGTQVNLLWVVIGAVLVVFMQAGFALVETGFCGPSTPPTWCRPTLPSSVGLRRVLHPRLRPHVRRLLVAVDRTGQRAGEAFIGSGHWVFLWKGGFGLTDLNGSGGAALAGFFLYMVAFMDTTGTIPTGAMAERWQWKNFVLWGLFCVASTTRSSVRGRGAADGCRNSATARISASATSTSRVQGVSTQWAVSPLLRVRS